MNQIVLVVLLVLETAARGLEVDDEDEEEDE
jgi:hypothetical protein